MMLMYINNNVNVTDLFPLKLPKKKQIYTTIRTSGGEGEHWGSHIIDSILHSMYTI